MTIFTKQVADMMELLPEQEQQFALELVKRLVMAWDPDYTKLTEAEQHQLDTAQSSGYVDAKDVDWDNIGA